MSGRLIVGQRIPLAFRQRPSFGILLPRLYVWFGAGASEDPPIEVASEEEALALVRQHFPDAHVEPWDVDSSEAYDAIETGSDNECTLIVEFYENVQDVVREAFINEGTQETHCAGFIEWFCQVE